MDAGQCNACGDWYRPFYGHVCQVRLAELVGVADYLADTSMLEIFDREGRLVGFAAHPSDSDDWCFRPAVIPLVDVDRPRSVISSLVSAS